MIPIRQRVSTFSKQVEEIMLSLLLLALILLCCGRILFRALDYGGMIWADPLIRYLVLWSGFLGAAMATSKGKHISLDIIGYLLPAGLQAWTIMLNHFFSTIVSALLTYAALLFIVNEKEFGATGLLGIPSYLWNLIFPVAFCLITGRYLYQTYKSILSIITKGPLPTKSHGS